LYTVYRLALATGSYPGLETPAIKSNIDQGCRTSAYQIQDVSVWRSEYETGVGEREGGLDHLSCFLVQISDATVGCGLVHVSKPGVYGLGRGISWESLELESYYCAEDGFAASMAGEAQRPGHRAVKAFRSHPCGQVLSLWRVKLCYSTHNRPGP